MTAFTVKISAVQLFTTGVFFKIAIEEKKQTSTSDENFPP